VGDWVPLEKNSLYSSNTDTFFDNNNVVYEVFNDLTRGNCQSLARYSSDSWEYIPGPQASLCGSYLFYFDGENIPHLIQKIGGYSGVSGEIVISRYVNGAWEELNSTLTSTLVTNNNLSYFFIDDNFQPYFISGDNSNLSVFSYSGGTWSLITQTAFNYIQARNLKAEIDPSDNIFVAYNQYISSSDSKVVVKKYDGSAWTDLGITGLAPYVSSFGSFLLEDSIPYVAYSTSNANYIQKYNGTAWENVASSALVFSYPSLMADGDGNIYVAYVSYPPASKVNVSKLSGGVWTLVGSANFSETLISSLNLKFDQNSLPYVSYVKDSRFVVRRYSEQAEIYYTGEIQEAPENDGSIASTLIANLVNKTFSNAGGNLIEGTHYSITNYSAGLTPIITVDATGKKVAISFSGTALYHNDDNDVSNLAINFFDAAFSGGGAASILNNPGSLTIDFNSRAYASKIAIETASISAPKSNSLVAADSSNNIYLAKTYSLNGNTEISVKKYDGSAWSGLGGLVATSTNWDSLTLNKVAFDNNGVFYVVYQRMVSSSPKLSVKKYENGNWVMVGTPEFFSGESSSAISSDIAFDSGNVPYIILNADSTKGNKAVVMKYDGSDWVYVGNTGISIGRAVSTNIAFDSSDNPYIAFNDASDSQNQVKVKKLSAGSWVTVGSLSGFIGNIKLAINSDDQPIVITVSNTYLLQARRFDGSSWVGLGTNEITSVSNAGSFELETDTSHVPYFVYADPEQSGKLTLKRLINDSWEEVGLPGFSVGTIYGLYLFFGDGINPYVGYEDSGSTYFSIDRFLLPPAIADLSIDVVETRAALSWDEADGSGGEIDSYQVKYKTEEDDSWSAFSVPSKSMTLSRLRSNTQYESEVSAVNILGVYSEPLRSTIETGTLSAPDNLSYTSSFVFSVDEEVGPIFPEVIGEELSFSISPALPAGLSFSTSTGAISGAPTEFSATSTYLVTAENESGSESTEVVLMVKDVVPQNLNYPETELLLFRDRIMATSTPSVVGENVVFSISPALPAGLSFSTSTGAISGIPRSLSSLTTYVISVSNSGGSVSSELEIMVSEEAEFIYDGPKYYLLYQEIEPLSPVRFPENSELQALSLPNGLYINSSDNTIVGTPSTVGDGNYTLIAVTPAGNQSVELRIVIQDLPVGLSYNKTNSLAINQDVLIEPQSTPEYSVEYDISPDLPIGLSLNQSTGVISGFSAELSDETDYVVTATNMVGSASTTLKIAVSLPWSSVASPLEGAEVFRTAFDKEGNLYLAYINVDGELVVVKREDGSWTTISRFDTAFDYQDFGLSLDDDDNIYVYYINYSSEAGAKKYDGHAWSNVGSLITENATSQKLIVDGSGRVFSAVFSSGLGIEAWEYNDYGEYSIDRKDYDVAPSQLSYLDDRVYIINSPIDPLYPSVSGSVESYSVSPNLPEGLSLDTVTGVISGTPVETINEGTFVITASNESGSVSFYLDISVLSYWMLIGEGFAGEGQYSMVSDGAGNYYINYYDSAGSKVAKIDTNGNFSIVLHKEGAYYENIKISGHYLYAGYNEDKGGVGIEEYDLDSGTSTTIFEESGNLYLYDLEDGLNGELFVVYADYDEINPAFVVKEYNGNAWSLLGGEVGYAGEDYNGAKIKRGISGELYLLYTDSDDSLMKIREYRNQDGWQEAEAVFDDEAYSNGFEIDSAGNLYVSYDYYDKEGGAYYSALRKRSGGNWELLGDNWQGESTALAINSNQVPYIFVAGKDSSFLSRLNGSDWAQIGTDLNANYPVFLLDEDVPVVADNNIDGTAIEIKAASEAELPESNSDYNSPITAFSYPTPRYYILGEEINPIYPSINGSALTFSADNLPAGLSIDASTGVITGTSTEISNLSSYTITASNDSGETISAEISLAVVDFWAPTSPKISEYGEAFDLQRDEEGNVYMVFNEMNIYNGGYYVGLKRHNGETWESVGSVASANDERAISAELAINGEDIYIAYIDYYDNLLLVKRLEGSFWTIIGNPLPADFNRFDISLNQEGELFILMEYDYGSLVKTHQNDSWITLGATIYPSFDSQLALSEEDVDIVYLDDDNQIIVKRQEKFDDSGRGREVAVINDDLVNKGIVSPQNGRPDSASVVRFNQRVNIVPFSGASVIIPTGVTMSASSSFNIANLVAAAADVSDLTDINPAGALKFGLPDLGLSLSAPITINIPVNGFSDGQILKVYTKRAGSSWSELTSCSVLSGICSFQTTHLSEFAAGLGSSSASSSSSSSGSLPVVTACTEVIYSDFSATCINGYQYRNFLSKTPLNCSLTAVQIEAARRVCLGQDTTVAPEKGRDNSSQELKNSQDLRTDFLIKERTLVKKINRALTRRLLGKILLQVEEKGEAWYLNPTDGARYFLGRPSDALVIMKKLALGINNENFKNFWKNNAPARLSGRILLNVEDSGKAYYVNPTNLKLQYLGRPEDAFQVMRGAGLGINNENIRQLEIGEIK